eukprot:2110547-Pleurochrysis_carterae.AAC.1
MRPCEAAALEQMDTGRYAVHHTELGLVHEQGLEHVFAKEVRVLPLVIHRDRQDAVSMHMSLLPLPRKGAVGEAGHVHIAPLAIPHALHVVEPDHAVRTLDLCPVLVEDGAVAYDRHAARTHVRQRLRAPCAPPVEPRASRPPRVRTIPARARLVRHAADTTKGEDARDKDHSCALWAPHQCHRGTHDHGRAREYVERVVRPCVHHAREVRVRVHGKKQALFEVRPFASSHLHQGKGFLIVHEPRDGTCGFEAFGAAQIGEGTIARFRHPGRCEPVRMHDFHVARVLRQVRHPFVHRMLLQDVLRFVLLEPDPDGNPELVHPRLDQRMARRGGKGPVLQDVIGPWHREALHAVRTHIHPLLDRIETDARGIEPHATLAVH